MFTSHSQNLNFTGLIFFISFVQDASRNSVCHTATVIANSYMHCGTTSDTFLRYAINWISNIVNLFIPYFWFTDVLFVCLFVSLFVFFTKEVNDWLKVIFFLEHTEITLNGLEGLQTGQNSQQQQAWELFTGWVNLSVCVCCIFSLSQCCCKQWLTTCMYM